MRAIWTLSIQAPESGSRSGVAFRVESESGIKHMAKSQNKQKTTKNKENQEKTRKNKKKQRKTKKTKGTVLFYLLVFLTLTFFTFLVWYKQDEQHFFKNKVIRQLIQHQFLHPKTCAQNGPRSVRDGPKTVLKRHIFMLNGF